MYLGALQASAGFTGGWHWCTSFGCFIDWLDHWQTMLTGVGAIAAAAVSVFYLRKQITQADTQETARRRRRFTASRARLPLLLSETIQYADDVIELLKQYLDAALDHQDHRPLASLPRPTLPEQAILAFETLIEATDDDQFANVVADMIAQMQVLSSRLRGLATEAGGLGALNLQSYLLNAAKVHAYAAGMFAFARREADTPPHDLDWDLVTAALRLNGLYEGDYADLHAFVGRARERAAAA
jgi:hypothetical protein